MMPWLAEFRERMPEERSMGNGRKCKNSEKPPASLSILIRKRREVGFL